MVTPPPAGPTLLGGQRDPPPAGILPLDWQGGYRAKPGPTEVPGDGYWYIHGEGPNY